MTKFSNIKNLDEIGADIRNKLTPLKNLVYLIKRYEEVKDSKNKAFIMDTILSNINQCEISIEYLKNLL